MPESTRVHRHIITLHGEMEEKQERCIRHLDIFSSPEIVSDSEIRSCTLCPFALHCEKCEETPNDHADKRNSSDSQHAVMQWQIRRKIALCSARLRTHINKSVQSPRVRDFTRNQTQNGETNYQATVLHHVCHRSTSSRQSQHSPAHKQCRKKHQKMASATACMQRPSRGKPTQPMMASRVLAIFTSRNSFLK